jgi:hypothetical protein
MLTTCMLRMIVDLSDGACSDGACACALGCAPCACTRAGVPRQSAAIMTDAVEMRMVIPFFGLKAKNSYPRNPVDV